MRLNLSKKLLIPLVVLAALVMVPVATGKDLFDFYRSSMAVRAAFMGFRTSEISWVEPSGRTCEISFSKHRRSSGKNAVVFVHGFGDDRWGWFPLLKMARQKGLPVEDWILPDLPLHGKSRCPGIESPEAAGKMIALALQKGGIEPRLIVGSSLGALVASYVAQDFPESRVAWITPPFLEEPDMSQLIQLVGDIRAPSDTKRFLSLIVDPLHGIPSWLVGALHKRIVPATQILKHVNVLDARNMLYRIPASRVQFSMIGTEDKLCPMDRFDRSIHKTLSDESKLQYSSCRHDLLIACPEGQNAVIQLLGAK
jgi:pimeloyl-ACP methyl ester carboxylesterase